MRHSSLNIRLFIFAALLTGTSVASFGQGTPTDTVDAFQPPLEVPLTADSRHEFRAMVGASDSSLKLPHQFLVRGTESVWLDTLQLHINVHYIVEERQGTIRFLPELLSLLRADSPIEHTMVVRYQILPFAFRERYQFRELVTREDTVTGRPIGVATPTRAFSIDHIFGTGFYKSGSIVRGFSVGSNRDLSLSSGFRMQMAGKIASDVEIVAALTDENTPIQPEGNTQTLQEIDKVFVEIRSTDLSATLGDFNVELGGNEFGRFQRKLQGAQGRAQYRTPFSTGSVLLAGAVARGKFATNQFMGIEGVQGPYRLTGQNNERDIIIIAGSERVYVDGERMTRGETNDYIIDYATGELSFAARRLITGASRIVVDFEYTDRQYTRNLVGGKTGAGFATERILFNATIIREADDPDSPIDISLSDSDRVILRNAGGDRLKAARSGVDSVGHGLGQYVARDTLIDDQRVRFYVFAPTDTTAAFRVVFTYVGEGKGDYIRVSLGNFRFVGRGRGNYLPLRFLPMPQVHTLADFDLTARVTEYFSITGEYAVSSLDRNRFSPLPDAQSKGPAVNFGVALNPRDVHLGEMNIGSIDLRLRERFVDSRFVPIDRANEIEFNRRWNLEVIENVDEHIREASLRYEPVKRFMIGGGVGRIKRGDVFSSSRYDFTTSLAGDRLPRVNYDIEFIQSRDRAVDSRGEWTRHRGLAEYDIAFLTPGFRYEREVRRMRSIAADTLKPGTFQFNEYAPRLTLANIWRMSLTSEFEWRTDDLFLDGIMRRESNTFTQQYGWKLREWKTLASSVDVTLRNKKFTEQFRLLGDSDVETILLRKQTRYSPFRRGVETDWYYEAATKRSARLERVYVQVPRGTGTHRYLGDVNNNGIVDDPDFTLDRFDGDFVVITVPSDDLFPIVDLRTSSRIRVVPKRFLSQDGWFNRAISVLSTETYVRVEEKSREPDTRKIYFLRLSRFLDDSTTITGSNFFSQDLHVFENNPAFSTRFRFTQRKGFTQFALANERGYGRERSIRLRWQLVKEIANQVDYTNRRDKVTSVQRTSRTRDITGNTIASDWSYRPEQNIELGFTVSVGRAIDRDSIPAITADLNTQGVRLVYSLQQRGQGRIEFHREEVRLDRSKPFLPFELTGGRVEGKTWLWRLGIDYRIAEFIQASLAYDGRSEGARRPVHNARAEVRAFF